ncbi:hypothetical protein IWQ48_003269 [Labrenzia sp. EL_13]|nr:hypothetical protein [Labrenzia sp. EL_13]
MNAETKAKLLGPFLVFFSIPCLFLYPLALVWPSGWQWHGGEGEYYFQMIVGLYVVIGAFCIIGAKDPIRHRSMLQLIAWTSFVHGAVMGVQAVGDPREYGHLIADVPALMLGGLIIWYLLPPNEAAAQKGPNE